MKILKVEKYVAVFEAFYHLKLSLFGVKRGFNCSILFYKIHGSIFFEVGISNYVCGCILGWRSVAYHFRVTVTLTLTSDLVFRIVVSGAYLLYYLR